MIAALFYLQFHSTRNRLFTRLKRLKQPKYLLGFLAGGLYCYFYFFRFLFAGKASRGAAGLTLTPEWLGALELLGAFVLLLFVVGAWIFPHERAALAFTEAEVAFLLPAPVDRRTLIHFKLVKSQFGIMFTTLIMALLSQRFGQSGRGWIHLGGWWLILSTLNLHFLAASFARTRLLDLGVTTWRRRGFVILLLAVAAGTVGWWARQAMAPPAVADFAGVKALAEYVSNVLQSGPAPYLLYPFRMVVRPFLAQDVVAFLRTAWPVAGLLALHYLWVVRSNVAFEESTLALAQRRAEQIASVRQGRIGSAKHKRKRDPFPLAPTGPPAIALLWKNLIGAGSTFTLRTMLVILVVVMAPALILSLNASKSELLPGLGMFMLGAIVWLMFIGPQLMRQDFRADLRVADLLKLYPLAGWRVVLGELLAPAVILTAIQWILLLGALVLATRIPGGPLLPLPTRLSVAFAAGIILPMVNLVSMLIPNAAVLIFPSFFQSGQDLTQGIEATGQRLIFFFGQVLAFAVALIPAGAVFALVLFVGQLALNWVAVVPLAALAAAVVLGAEAAVGIGLLGKIFEKFDLSSEPQN